MGVDLTLLPLLTPTYWASHDVIRVNRCRELWADVLALPQQPIPEPLSCYVAQIANNETGYGNRENSPYGERLCWTTAGALATLKDHPAIQDDWINKAVLSYLRTMPEDWPIVLYWH